MRICWQEIFSARVSALIPRRSASLAMGSRRPENLAHQTRWKIPWHAPLTMRVCTCGVGLQEGHAQEELTANKPAHGARRTTNQSARGRGNEATCAGCTPEVLQPNAWHIKGLHLLREPAASHIALSDIRLPPNASGFLLLQANCMCAKLYGGSTEDRSSSWMHHRVKG